MLFIQHYLAKQSQAPSLHEIANDLGVKSKSAALRAVTQLEEAGFIARPRSILGRRHAHARGIELLKTLPDDRFEEAAKAVCAVLGHSEPGAVAKARAAIVSTLVERNAA